MKKSKKLKIQNRFLVIKHKNINKNSNPSGCLYFPSSLETNRINLPDKNRLIRFGDMKCLNIHTHIHTSTKTKSIKIN